MSIAKAARALNCGVVALPKIAPFRPVPILRQRLAHFYGEGV